MTSRAQQVVRAPLQVLCLPLVLAALRGRTGELVALDATAWRTRRRLPCDPDTVRTILWLLVTYSEWRSLMYKRMGDGGPLAKVVGVVYRQLLRPHPTLVFVTRDIGPGLIVIHGEGTYIGAKSIGADVMVMQQVTMGTRDLAHERTAYPVIEDGVFLGPGCRVLGDVTVGAGATVGANAVVLKDVPAGAKAYGVPARVVLDDDGSDLV